MNFYWQKYIFVVNLLCGKTKPKERGYINPMKKLLAVLMAVAMLLSFAAFGGDKEEETTVPEETTAEEVAGG